jgi:hypothetical protein
VQDQPVVGIEPEDLRHDLLELQLNLEHVLARREAGAIADAEDVRVDRKRLLTEGRVEHDVRRLPADTRQLLQLFPRGRNPAAMIADQGFG